MSAAIGVQCSALLWPPQSFYGPVPCTMNPINVVHSYLLCWVGLVVLSDLQLGSSFLQVKVMLESDKIIEIAEVVTPLIPALGRMEGLHLCEFKSSPGLHSDA